MTSSVTSSRVTLSEFIYGTAWKEDQTKRLVKEALVAGFRKVDTAAQPKHHQKDLVGDGLREAYAKGIVRREDLIVRVKYNISVTCRRCRTGHHRTLDSGRMQPALFVSLLGTSIPRLLVRDSLRSQGTITCRSCYWVVASHCAEIRLCVRLGIIMLKVKDAIFFTC
jgi:hypothetical protein